MLCSQVHRAAPERKYADRGSTRKETRSQWPLPSDFLRRNVHADTRDKPMKSPKTGRSLCQPIGATGAYSVSRTCSRSSRVTEDESSSSVALVVHSSQVRRGFA